MASYQSALAYIDSYLNTEKSPDFSRHARHYNLHRITQLLKRLGNPQHNLRSIHVAGSKGKGSTATFIASILTCAGYRTGLFTSPHFVSPRERCCINGVPISKNDFTRCIANIRPAIEAVSDGDHGRISFFEIYTALALFYFAQQKVDLAVIEVGLGGRLDATNVIHPELTVITPISLEHTQILGESIAVIAQEKAGIIKPDVPLVLAPQPKSAETVFETVASQNRVEIHHVSKNIVRHYQQPEGQVFDFESDLELFITVAGRHQLINAATSVTAVRCLVPAGLPEGAVRQGLAQTELKGRLQVVPLTDGSIEKAAPQPQLSEQSTHQLVLDGAHTPDSIEALLKTVQQIFDYEHLLVVVGLMRDKPVTQIGEIVCAFADQVITTQPFHNARVVEAQRLADDWSGLHPRIVPVPSVTEAFRLARSVSPATENTDAPPISKRNLICVTGSIYLVGEVLKLLGIGDIDAEVQLPNTG